MASAKDHLQCLRIHESQPDGICRVGVHLQCGALSCRVHVAASAFKWKTVLGPQIRTHSCLLRHQQRDCVSDQKRFCRRGRCVLRVTIAESTVIKTFLFSYRFQQRMNRKKKNNLEDIFLHVPLGTGKPVLQCVQDTYQRCHWLENAIWSWLRETSCKVSRGLNSPTDQNTMSVASCLSSVLNRNPQLRRSYVQKSVLGKFGRGVVWS